MTIFYEIRITGPDREGTEVHYELPKAKASFEAIKAKHSKAHTIDLRRIETELMASFDGEVQTGWMA